MFMKKEKVLERKGQGPPISFKEKDGDLWIVKLGAGTKEEKVSVKSCFPWSQANNYYSFINQEGEEVLFLENLEGLKDSEKKIVTKYLAQNLFCFEIKEILSVTDRMEFRHFKVTTQAGEREFLTKIHHLPRVLNSGGLLFEDIFHDFYEVKNMEELSEKSQRFLDLFVE